MKRIVLFLTAALALCTAKADQTDTAPNTQAPAYLASLLDSADTVTINYYFPDREQTVASFVDKDWNRRLAAVLREATYSPRSHCMCISFPRVEVKKDGGVVLTLSVHHKTKVRAYAKDVSGDFEVGEEIGGKISALAGEKKALAVPSKPAPPKP